MERGPTLSFSLRVSRAWLGFYELRLTLTDVPSVLAKVLANLATNPHLVLGLHILGHRNRLASHGAENLGEKGAWKNRHVLSPAEAPYPYSNALCRSAPG